MDLRKILIDLYQLGIVDTELENGTIVENITVQAGDYPTACRGFIKAVVNNREVKYPFRLECQNCGGCD